MKRSSVVALLALALAGPARAEDARALFASQCALCHGPDGKGQTAMGKRMGAKDLSKEKEEPESQLVKSIAGGRPPKMPAFKGKLTPEQIQALAQLIKAGI